MSAYLLAFLVFFLHIVVIPIGISPFEVPKVIAAEVLIDLLLIIKILQLTKHHIKGHINSQNVFILILFITSLIDLLLFKPAGSFWGNNFRLAGVFLFWHLLILPSVSKDIKLGHFKKLFLALSLIFLFLGTIILGVNQSSRAFGTLGEPNALAAVAVFLLPLLFFGFRKTLRIVFILLALFIILLSGSRSGWMAFLFELGFFMSAYLLELPKTVFISVVLIIFSLVLPNLTNQDLFENRSQVWQASFEAGKNSPLIGQGVGNIQEPIHQASLKIDSLISKEVVDSSHNFLLDYWVQMGAVGVICMLMLVFLTLDGFIKAKKVPEAAAFLGTILVMLFNPVSVASLVGFWWLIGQGMNSHS